MHVRFGKQNEENITMKLSEALLSDYAKKILGFAYEKVGNSYEAEELAQEIMLQLLNCIHKQTEVEHLSSFVYTVCCYTWSKYLRKNKKHWDYVDLDEAGFVADGTDVEAEVIDRMLYAKLRKTISSLAKKQREIIVLHYYENKTTSEIAKLLDMNDSTVRWYLGNIRDTLKEKLNMSENLDFRPVSLCVGMDGWFEEPGYFDNLQSDLLVQNIALACYGEPLTITEISEKLNVAAAYLEKHIENMVYMDFLRQHGKKYQTNFFINNKQIIASEIKYVYENAKPYADKLYEAVMARKSDILAIDYYGKGRLNEDYFLWYVLLKAANEKDYEQKEKVWRTYGITERPLRKDGSRYWLMVHIRENMEYMNDTIAKYMKYHQCSGYKENCVELGRIYQADTYFSNVDGEAYRSVTDGQKIVRFLQAAQAIMRIDSGVQEGLNDFEKMYVAEFVESGYITMKDGKPVLNIPVFTEAQKAALDRIVNEIKEGLGEDFMKEYLLGYGKMMEQFIPAFLDKNIRNYHKYAMMGGFDLFAHLIQEAKEGGKCSLKLPDKADGRHMMTWLVMNS